MEASNRPFRPFGLEVNRAGVSAATALAATVAACTVLRPLRDEQATRLGAEALPTLFAMTFTMLVAISAALFVASRRVHPTRLVARTAGIASVVVIGLGSAAVSAGASSATGVAFVVAFGVFNVLAVALAWHAIARHMPSTGMPRHLATAATGAGIGAIAGPAIATLIAPTLGPAALVPAAACMIAVAIVAVSRLGDSSWGEASTRPARVRMNAFSPPRIGATAILVGGWSTVATLLYFCQVDIVGRELGDSTARTVWFASVDLVASCAALVVQLLTAAAFGRRTALQLALGIGPLLVAIAFLALWCHPELVVIAGATVVARIGGTSLLRPAREVLLASGPSPVAPQTRCAIDGVLVRGVDAVVATVIGSVSGGVASAGCLALVGSAIAMTLGAVGLHIGRNHDEPNRRESAPRQADVSRGTRRRDARACVPVRARRIIGADAHATHSSDR